MCEQFVAGGQYDFIGFLLGLLVIGSAIWFFVRSFR